MVVGDQDSHQTSGRGGLSHRLFEQQVFLLSLMIGLAQDRTVPDAQFKGRTMPLRRADAKVAAQGLDTLADAKEPEAALLLLIDDIRIKTFALINDPDANNVLGHIQGDETFFD